MARVEVIIGPEWRRRWSAEQKQAIVAESLASAAVVTEIAGGRIFVPARSIGGDRRPESVAASPSANRPSRGWRRMSRGARN
jgi:hypothetical protein